MMVLGRGGGVSWKRESIERRKKKNNIRSNGGGEGREQLIGDERL